MSALRLCRTLALTGFATVAAFSATPAHAAGAKNGDTFGDWTMACPPPGDKSGAPCRLAQIEKVTAPNGQSVTLLKAAVFHTPKDGFALFGYLPIGYAIPPGIKLSIDGGKPFPLYVQRCIPRGCEAAIKMDGELLTQMKKGKKANIEFINNGKPQTISVSLKGLSDGLSKF